jgi:hypothetical protein
MRALVLSALLACSGDGLKASVSRPLPPHQSWTLDRSPKERPRILAQESYLRAYMHWFGDLTPLAVQSKARKNGLFGLWDDYLPALGFPDYRHDLPRAEQSNALMLATGSRLAEALCIRAAEHDFAPRTAPSERTVFAFDLKPQLTVDEFAERFDVLHRLFLSYPLSLAPRDRLQRFYTLYETVADHTDATRAWAGVCTALVQHPEASVY